MLQIGSYGGYFDLLRNVILTILSLPERHLGSLLETFFHIFLLLLVFPIAVIGWNSHLPFFPGDLTSLAGYEQAGQQTRQPQLFRRPAGSCALSRGYRRIHRSALDKA